MIYHYLPQIKTYSSSEFPVKFFSYIAGGFSSSIATPLNKIVESTGVNGSAMPVSTLIKMIERNFEKRYSHEELQNIFSLNRQVAITDL